MTRAQVHAFRLARHHLISGAPKKDLARVVGDIGGVQALMSAAEMQVGVRVDCTVDAVRAALWKTKKLVKTWLMRGTLHLLPAADLPLFTLRITVAPFQRLPPRTVPSIWARAHELAGTLGLVDVDVKLR